MSNHETAQAAPGVSNLPPIDVAQAAPGKERSELLAEPLGLASTPAARLSRVPQRTVQEWRTTGFLRPTVAVWPPDGGGVVNRCFPWSGLAGDDLPGRPRWLYALGDVVALAVAHDLRKLKIPIDALTAKPDASTPSLVHFVQAVDWRKELEWPAFEWLQYLTPEGYDFLADGAPPDAELDRFSFFVDAGAKRLRADCSELFDLEWIVLYPLRKRAAEIVEGVDGWLQKQRSPIAGHSRPSWL